MPTILDIQRIAAERGNCGEPHFSKEMRASSARIRKAREYITRLPDKARLLDIGCGDGAIVEPFLRRLELHGVDASSRLVEVARRKGIDAKCVDSEKLPYPESHFDAVFAGEVIEHTLSPDLFLAEINRVLRASGLLIMTIPNIRTPIGLLMMILGYAPMHAARYGSSHYRDFTWRLVKLALSSNGFTIEGFRGSTFMVPGLGPTLPLLADVLPTWADYFVVVARKTAEASYNPEYDFKGWLELGPVRTSS